MDIKKINLFGVVLACLASCTNDELVETNNLPNDGQTATVRFEMNANTGNYSPLSRSIAPLTKEQFRIMAFKKSNDDNTFYYTQDVPTDNMNFTNEKLSGTARLPIGEYKFVSTYGLKQSKFIAPDFTQISKELSDDIRITQNELDDSSVIFLENAPLAELPSYMLGINPEANKPIQTTLGRAVSRVDVLFLQSKKNENGEYVEVSDSSDVFGVSKLESIEMKFTDLNSSVNLVGRNTGVPQLFNANFSINGDLKNVTNGSSTDDTKVGTSGFINYDGITPEDIKKGSAHVHGTYVLPFDAQTTTGLQLVLKNKRGDTRIINAPANLPLERNKVTIVKIRVLSGTVFNTDVNFDITIDTEWLEAKTVDGEIS